MQQLTLQFDGFAPMGRTIDAKAPAREVQVKNPRSIRGTHASHTWDRLVPQVAQTIATYCRAHRDTLQDTVECAAVMAASVVVILMAAVLQGGAA